MQEKLKVKRLILIILQIFLLIDLIYSQTNLISIKIINDNGRPIKNVNLQFLKSDTIYVTDTSGIVKIAKSIPNQNIKIKKFGYKLKSIGFSNQDTIVSLEKDSTAECKNVKFVDYKFTGNNGNLLIKLNICGDTFLFYGGVYLANGKDIETYNEWFEIFQNHKIENSYLFDVANCKSTVKLRHENYKTNVLLIYYNSELKKRKSNHVPSLVWRTNRESRKDFKILNLKYECQCD